MKRYSIAVWHGERRTIFQVVRQDSEKETEWTVVATCNTRSEAEGYINRSLANQARAKAERETASAIHGMPGEPEPEAE